MVKAGLSPMDAIVAATGNAAELLGRSGSLRAITPGAYADLVGVTANPIEDIGVLEGIDFVMIGRHHGQTRCTCALV